MKIYGGHDYYDCGLSLGIDPSIVLARFSERYVEVGKKGPFLPKEELKLNQQGNSSHIETLAVAFCGKIYQGAYGHRTVYSDHSEYFWSSNKLLEWSTKHDLQVQVVKSWRERSRASDLERFFEPRESPPALRDYMIENKLSILVSPPAEFPYGKVKRLAVNPSNLKLINFAKAIDPYTAFQELSMWIGGVLGGSSPELVSITNDKVLAESHGFDRFSFRGPRI